jgi:hypothetical protein
MTRTIPGGMVRDRTEQQVLTAAATGTELTTEDILEQSAIGAGLGALSYAKGQMSKVSKASADERFLAEKQNIQEAIDMANDCSARGDQAGARLLRQLAVDTAASALDLKVPSGWTLKYGTVSGGDAAGMDPKTKTVTIGDKSFRDASYLGSTLIHEFTHVAQLMSGQYSPLGNQPGVFDPGWDRFNMNEIEALQAELNNAGRTGLSGNDLAGVRHLLGRAGVAWAYGVDQVNPGTTIR